MSTESLDGVAAVTEQVPSTLTITHYQQVADRFRAALQEVLAIAPPFDEKAAVSAKKHLNVPRAAMETAIASVERNEELQRTKKLDVSRSREHLQYMDAFRPVRDDGAAFVQRLDAMLDVRQAEVSKDALEVYHVAKSLARDGHSVELTAAVANMKRDLGRRGARSLPPEVREAMKRAAAEARAKVINEHKAALAALEVKSKEKETEPRVTAARS